MVVSFCTPGESFLSLWIKIFVFFLSWQGQYSMKFSLIEIVVVGVQVVVVVLVVII